MYGIGPLYGESEWLQAAKTRFVELTLNSSFIAKIKHSKSTTHPTQPIMVRVFGGVMGDVIYWR